MDDLISRQAAIDVTWKEPIYTDPYNVLTEVRDGIKALPSAQPEGKTYEDGWREGREALRREIWEDGRDRLD